MIFHENCPDNSHEISYLIFRKLGKMSSNLSSTAVVIGALRVKTLKGKLTKVKLENVTTAKCDNPLHAR